MTFSIFHVRSCLFSLCLLAFHPVLQAATFHVNTTTDLLNAPGQTSLRQAVVNANTNGTDNTIVLFNGVFNLTIPGAHEDACLTGDLDITNTNGTLTILGPATIDAHGIDRIFDVFPGAALVLSNIVVTGGELPDTSASHPAEHGGGIRAVDCTVDLQVCNVISNQTGSGIVHTDYQSGLGIAGSGGGLYAENSDVLIYACSFANNQTGSGGRIIVDQSGDQYGRDAGHGGGIATIRSDVIMRDSTISFNRTGDGGDTSVYSSSSYYSGSGGHGGGFYVGYPEAYSTNTAEVSVLNSTFYGNVTGDGGLHDYAYNGKSGFGGGVFLYDQNTTVSLISCTVTSNDVRRTGGGGGPGDGGGVSSWFSFGASIALRNSIVCQNLADSYPNIRNVTVGAGNLIDANASLNLLGDNGGHTLTVLPKAGSPAIGAGDNTVPTSADQRGLPRQIGFRVDAGAVERDVSSLAGTLTTLPVTNSIQNVAHGTYSADMPGESTSPLYTGMHVEYGLTPDLPLTSSTNFYDSSVTPGNYLLEVLSPAFPLGRTLYYRVLSSNDAAVAVGQILQFTPPTGFNAADTNSDGTVDTNELAQVLAGVNGGDLQGDAMDVVLDQYWEKAPWPQLTSVGGFGQPELTFRITNAPESVFTVLATDDMTNWFTAGEAYPGFYFTDTNAPPVGSRSYQLQRP